MRTKHLLYTAAFAAMFSACTNDDFILDTPQNNVTNDGRPTVSDVRLNFIGNNPETRVAFDGEDGYAWEANDTIGALLMDNVTSVNAKTWLGKYELTSNIHTSYPFTYNSSDETWGCNTKMLEGNYFFAYPWESYGGRREVVHSLLNQQQDGIGSDVVAKSYAENQFFIGYAQIMAGTNDKDVLTDVEMVPVLGAIQLRITNTGTQTYHINKVVLSGENDKIASVLTFNPTDAKYGIPENDDKWNLTSPMNAFNYANYTGNEVDVYTDGSTDYVYNIEEGDAYSRIEALRAVVKTHATLSTENSAQLTINGTKEERALTNNKTAYVLIMCNPFKPTTGELNLSIYTDEGMVSNIDLTKIYAESADYTVVTDSEVKEIGPSVTNTIGVQIDDNSFVVPVTMDIFNGEDLLQYIKWNTQIAGNRNVTATLKQDITFTKEMLDILQTNSKTNVTITSTGKKLTLAADVPATVLDDAQLNLAGIDVIVEGALELTEKSDAVKSIEVAEGATLTINDAKAVLPNTIENNGTLEIGANAAIANGKTITNNAVVNVAKDADCKATITNNADAVINNNGYLQNTKNEKDGQIVLGTGAILMNVNNAGIIKTAANSQVSGSNAGEIIYVSGAKIVTGGTIAYEVAGATLDDAAIKTLTENKVNKLILKQGITTITTSTAAATVSFGAIDAEDGSALTVGDKVTLTVGTLTVEGGTTLDGDITVTNVVVEKEGTLTNNGDITADAFTNNGTVNNNGSVKVPEGADGIQGNGTWKYNQVEDANPTVSDKQATMNETVEEWASYWGDYIGAETYYDGNPYNIEKFIATVNVWVDMDPSNDYAVKAKALKEAWVKAGESFDDVLKDDNGNAVSEFTTAVGKVLTNVNFTALKKIIINTATGAFQNVTINPDENKIYETETEAYDVLRTFLAHPSNITGTPTALVAATAWKFTDSEIATALSKGTGTVPYTYVWKGCPLDEVMTAYNKLTIDQWKSALNEQSLEAATDMDKLEAWMDAIAITTSSSLYIDAAKAVVEKYLDEYKNWQYSATQITLCGK